MRHEPGSPARLAYNYASALRKVTRFMIGLATCPTCNFPLAPNAVACPRCGRPIAPANTELGMQNLALSRSPEPDEGAVEEADALVPLSPAEPTAAAPTDFAADILAASTPADSAIRKEFTLERSEGHSAFERGSPNGDAPPGP